MKAALSHYNRLYDFPNRVLKVLKHTWQLTKICTFRVQIKLDSAVSVSVHSGLTSAISGSAGNIFEIDIFLFEVFFNYKSLSSIMNLTAFFSVKYLISKNVRFQMVEQEPAAFSANRALCGLRV